MILDKNGDPIPQERVRKAMGFRESFLSADDPDTINVPTPNNGRNWSGPSEGDWYSRDLGWRNPEARNQGRR